MNDAPLLHMPRILIAEDDPATQTLLHYMFDAEYALTIASDGDTVIEALRTQVYDLMLLDIGLPYVNGLDILQSVRSGQFGQQPPIIIISALSDREIVIRALHLGANDYVNKPFDLEVLRARMETQLDLQRFILQQQQEIEALVITRDTQQKLCRVISHDLQSPLTNFRIGHYLLREMMRATPEAYRVIDNMELTLEAIVNMVGVFVDAINSQQLRPLYSSVDPARLSSDVMNQHILIAERKRIGLSGTIAPGELWGDPRMLNQALSNLVNNAIKFSQPDTAITVIGEPIGAVYRFSVRDQGPGIPPEDRESLFGMFGKLRNRPTGGESSTGLGLWIVRQLIELHRGTYGLDAPPEGGSIFWIEVPIAPPA